MDRDGVLRSLAAAVAVLVALLLPATVAHVTRSADKVVPVSEELPAEGPGARDWTGVDCGDACAVPARLELRERRYQRGPGARQEVVRRDVRSRTLTHVLRLTGSSGHVVLVGALRSSSASDLSVTLGAGRVFDVPHGRPTLLRVPPGTRTVILVERGRSSAAEELVVQEYALSDRG